MFTANISLQLFWVPTTYALVEKEENLICRAVVSLIADPEAISSIPAQPKTFLEIDHQMMWNIFYVKYFLCFG